MRRHWKDLAERAAAPAFTAEQVAEAFPVALKNEFSEAPLTQIRDILGGSAQSSLFEEDRAVQLEAVRRACPGSATGNTLIDCALEANANGLTGDAATKTALENALRAMREAYADISGRRKSRLVERDRLNAALLEVAINDARIVNNLASNMINNPGNLGLRPAGEGAPAQQQQSSQSAPASSPAASAPATGANPAASSSPVSVRPANGNANANK